MTEKYFIPRVLKTPPHSFSRIALIIVSMSAVGLLMIGCAGHGLDKKVVAKGAQNIIYQVTEQEALDLAQWAMSRELPGQKIHRLKMPRLGLFVHEVEQPGNYKYARFRETTFIYELDLIHVRGSLDQGGDVSGYTYALKGNGDLKRGPDQMARLEKRLKEAFDQSGRAVAVNAVQPEKQGPPRISSNKPPVMAAPVPTPSMAPPAAETAPAQPRMQDMPAAAETPSPAQEQPAEDVFVKLKKIKELRDQGIITEEEFQAKKKELLDRI